MDGIAKALPSRTILASSKILTGAAVVVSLGVLLSQIPPAMGPTLSVSTKIEIQASPAVVRATFMNWPRFSQWQPNPNWNLRAVEQGKHPLDLKEGDALNVSMDGKVHQPVVVENSPAAFKWKGSMFGVGSGIHQFHFTPSEENPGATTFVQGEDFQGIAVTLSQPWWKGRTFDMGPWDKFNACLKAEAEKSAGASE